MPAAAHAHDRGSGQRPSRHAALRTRSRSTCLRATRRGSAALTIRGSHARARHVETTSRSEVNRWPGCLAAGAPSVPTHDANPRPAAPIPPGRAGSAPVRSATVRSATVRSATVRSATVRSATVRSATVRSATVRSAPGSGQPWRTQLSERAPRRGSGSAESGRCWQSHQVPPGQSSWCWRRQDRQTMDIVWPAAAGQCARYYLLRGLPEEPGQDQPDQAALARRIRRRRSEARSSSFRPPHVPYFSGREIA
jgi:hypothetical protein